MPTYTLNTEFTNQDLERFYMSGTNVIIAKETAGGTHNIAWVVFRPLQKNTVQWDDNYGIYASNTDLMNGVVVNQMATTGIPAVIEKTYDFGPNGIFGPPTSPGSPNAYTAGNHFNNLPKGYLTMGLTQDAAVNGTHVTGNVASATVVLFNSSAVLAPGTTIKIWAQSQVVSNTVITTITSPVTQVTFGGGITDIDLKYDPQSGKFIPSQKMNEAISLQHIQPVL